MAPTPSGDRTPNPIRHFTFVAGEDLDAGSIRAIASVAARRTSSCLSSSSFFARQRLARRRAQVAQRPGRLNAHDFIARA